MAEQAHAALQFDLRADDAIGSDLDGGINARAGGNARGRVDRHFKPR